MEDNRDIFSDTLDSLFDEKMRILDKIDETIMTRLKSPKANIFAQIVLTHRLYKLEKEFREVNARYNKLSTHAKDYYKLVEELG